MKSTSLDGNTTYTEKEGIVLEFFVKLDPI